jgi:chromosome segregation ATPase
MADQDISFAAVAAAAQALTEAGQPVQLAGVRAALPPEAGLAAVLAHLEAWRAARAEQAAPPEPTTLPDALTSALAGWARQLAETASATPRERLAQTQDDLAALAQLLARAEAERDQVLARLAEREAAIERLTLELRHARDIASEALVGKAKDQLAIQGKDAQLAELRGQLERQLARSAAESDARLAAEMELVGATTARDNLAAELAALRAQQDAGRAV